MNQLLNMQSIILKLHNFHSCNFIYAATFTWEKGEFVFLFYTLGVRNWGIRFWFPRKKMVQVVSLSTLGSCGRSRLCGSSQSWMAPFESFKRSQIASFTGRHLVWNHSMRSLFLIGYPCVSRQSGFKAEAAWMFRGGEQGLDASSEQSESANEDILMFFFQLDLATRVQVWLLLLFC